MYIYKCIFQRYDLENKNRVYTETSVTEMANLYNLECWETRKEVLQIFDPSQSEEGLHFFCIEYNIIS